LKLLNLNFRRFECKSYAQEFFAIIPFFIFFPIGIIHLGALILIVLIVIEGGVKEKWSIIKSDKLFIPFIVLALVVLLNFLFLSTENVLRWSSVIHYLIFIYYFAFVSVGRGDWQRKAKNVFIIGAVYGASVFYLSHLNFLPDWTIFKNYTIYRGNKSISLGIFLAIAAAWLLSDVLHSMVKRRQWIEIIGFVYISLAILFLVKTRTGMLLFFILSLLVTVRHLQFSPRGLALALSLVLIPVVAWNSSFVFRERSLVTVEAVRAFSAGEMGTGQGNRLQFVSKTGEMILEKPLLGHGIGSWLQQYPVRAQGLETAQMSTPHSDYLLYAAELGVVGLLALLAILGRLLLVAWRIRGVQGMQLLVLGSALIVGCAFNAILRDWKFGLPMMILLAVAMSDDRYSKVINPDPCESIK